MNNMTRIDLYELERELEQLNDSGIIQLLWEYEEQWEDEGLDRLVSELLWMNHYGDNWKPRTPRKEPNILIILGDEDEIEDWI